jgi:hypothetical protein
LHDNISLNGYENAIIGRYGVCFEKDIRRLMCDRAYHITGFGCIGEVCSDSRGEKRQCTVPKRLAICGKVGVCIIHELTLVIKNSYTYCERFISPRSKVLLACLQGGGWEELTIAGPRIEQHKDSINDKLCSDLAANVRGHHFTCMRIYLRKDLLPLTTFPLRANNRSPLDRSL